MLFFGQTWAGLAVWIMFSQLVLLRGGTTPLAHFDLRGSSVRGPLLEFNLVNT